MFDQKCKSRFPEMKSQVKISVSGFFSSVVKTIKISSPGSWGEGWEEGIVREFGIDKNTI